MSKIQQWVSDGKRITMRENGRQEIYTKVDLKTAKITTTIYTKTK